MRTITLLPLLLAGCATTPAGLMDTRVETTVASSKTTAEFANCTADALAGSVDVRSQGEHYWVIRNVWGTPRHRWDFHPTETGSRAELRSTGLAGAGEDKVRDCA